MVYITGDTHIPIDVHKLNTSRFPEQRKLTKDDIVVICGDFGGIWDGSDEEQYWLNWLNDKPFTTLFLDGNHENFKMLSEFPVTDGFGGKVHTIRDSIYHLLRGEIYEIGSKTFFVMGGASSHDKIYRIPKVSWWEEELPSIQEQHYALRNLERHNWEVDYILSHCAPKEIQRSIADWYQNDSLTSFLQIVENECQFKHWFFGHYHIDKVIDKKHTALYQRIIPIREEV